MNINFETVNKPLFNVTKKLFQPNIYIQHPKREKHFKENLYLNLAHY